MYEKTVLEILKLLRGDLDQQAMSRLMNYSYNKYFKFEAGYKVFRLEDFIEVCELSENIDLKTVFKKSLNLKIDDLNQEELIGEFCKIWGSPSDYLLIEELEISSSKWWRIKNNKSPISLIDFLRIIDKSTDKLSGFLSHFFNSKVVAELLKSPISYSTSMEQLKNNPDMAILLAGVYLGAYTKAKPKDRLKVLFKSTGLSKERFDELLDLTLKYEICFYDENGILKVRTFKSEFRKNETDISTPIFLYTQNLVHQNINLPLERKSFKIAPVSKVAKDKISLELAQAYKNISNIIENEPLEDKDEILVLSQAMFTIPKNDL